MVKRCDIMGSDYVKKNLKLVCVDCGSTSQKSGKSWELFNRCYQCACKLDPDFYKYLKCKLCGATSNHTSADCWKQNLCGKCATKKRVAEADKEKYHILCPDCKIVVFGLVYQKLGRRKIPLYYCVSCSGIISDRGHKIFEIKGIVI